jgi:hypothetical protein
MIDLIKEYRKAIITATALRYHQDNIVESYIQSMKFPKIEDLEEKFEDRNDKGRK